MKLTFSYEKIEKHPKDHQIRVTAVVIDAGEYKSRRIFGDEIPFIGPRVIIDDTAKTKYLSHKCSDTFVFRWQALAWASKVEEFVRKKYVSWKAITEELPLPESRTVSVG